MAKDRQIIGYSPMQVALHWTVLVLVAFQYFAHDGIENAWRSFLRGDTPPDDIVLNYLHIGSGILVLFLVLLRLYLRMTRGAPAPPADEPRLLQLLAEGVHGSIYVLLLLLPVSGAIAWFLGSRLAGDAHELLQNFLLAAIALHVAGAMFQHFILRSQVLMRMLRPQRR